ncbi:S8 family serine peptidase [Streptomyces sp. AK02-01A]|uniref:S8 family serine peptidase n=1 Tax=Streptomyces sp. AK02-01A TaxID=3028648 RepID=UPI0029A7DFC4|nr:S8 family serine peptidase [Streptomyces sp. AK02-01A]MDX3850589.1 S8 family serine peptidase [Streptomyces sp. AK02-01A]
MQLPSRRRGLLALSTALAVLAAVPAAGASASSLPAAASSVGASAVGGSPAAVAAASGSERTITLITGDKVTVSRAADGTVSHSVRGPDGRLDGFEINRTGDDTYVYPHSSLPYIAADLLDKGLFNVTRLLADGYDDAHTDRLPLIVTYTGAAAASRARAPEGARTVRALSSIRGAALTADRSAGFWSALTGGEAGAAGARTGAGPVLTAGIAKVWLDGKVKADLADSTAQIGAPQVWQSGNTGQGVDVAVLDTGIDRGHPDVGDRVTAEASFVPGEDATDLHGHGTHVASTIAGTGAASDGKEKGVAPGADLHIGKVLDKDGSGQDSWIVAGMEWAARDQHAKVISMSLGGGPTDGSDPLSMAVDQLSAETGALFTIAAGNSGPNAYSVSAPGAADAALTVGAVDGADQLAEFSSQGPRVGDGALKPDLTAPGVDILAARSQYAAEGEGYYQTMSGTSMATPHVAGAAALLAARHPDWSGAQLKDALVSTTKATPQYGAYQAGSGRLDIAGTSAGTVFATGSVYSGYQFWPTPAGHQTRREVTYTNTGGTPVTLDLSTRVPGAPEGVFTLSSSQLTVPAHGTGKVTVTADFDRLPADRMLTGSVDATDAAGVVRAHTTIGAGREGERHTLTLKARDRDGKPLSGTIILAGKKFFAPLLMDESGTLDLRLPPGTYTAWMDAELEGANGPHSRGRGLLTLSEITLDQDTTATIDASRARQIKAVTPRKTTSGGVRLDVYRGFADDDYSASEIWPDASYDSVWTLPTGKKVSEGEFVFGARWRLEQPALTVSSGTRVFDDLRAHRGAAPLREGRHTLDAVFAGDGGTAGYRSLKARGRAVVVRRNNTVPLREQADAATAAGAALLLVVNDGDGRLEPWGDSIWGASDLAPLPVATLSRDEGEQLITRIRGGGRRTLEVTSNPVTGYLYDLVHHWDGAVPAEPTYRPGGRELARVDVSFRNHQPGKAVETRGDVWKFGETALNDTGVPARGDRTDWVTAGVEWGERAQLVNVLHERTSGLRTYRAGTTTPLHWFGPVQRPRMDDEIAPVRLDDTIAAFVPGWGDSGAGHIGTTSGNSDVSNALTLYQGASVVGEMTIDQIVVSGLRRERLPYRLVSENSRGAWSAPYSTSTRTEWEFTSGAGAVGEAGTLPLIQLDYAVDTDTAGRAGRRAGLTLTPSHLTGAPESDTIRTVTLDVSYDDGASWHKATLRRSGKGWETTLKAPARADFVTLRASARDTRGNSVEQRINRAFGLR